MYMNIHIHINMGTLSVLSFNVMFNDIKLRERHESMVTYILSLVDTGLDVICLQEVLNPLYEFFVEKFSEEFTPVFSYIQPPNSPYGVCIFVRKGITVHNKGMYELPSKYKRVLAHASIEKDSIPYKIVTFHLESLNDPKIRKKQVEILFKEFSKKKNAIFCGDTNIKNTEKVVLHEKFLDAAVVFEDYEDTYFGDRFWNSKSKQRYDRFFFKKTLNCTCYKPIFSEKIEEIESYLSDHSAIYAEFSTELEEKSSKELDLESQTIKDLIDIAISHKDKDIHELIEMIKNKYTIYEKESEPVESIGYEGARNGFKRPSKNILWV